MSLPTPLNLDPSILGARLAEARRDRKLTQQDAADAIDVARTTITAIEKGTRKPRASELAKLLLLYGRSVSEFASAPESPKSPPFSIQFRGPKSASLQPGVIQQFERLCHWYRELEIEDGILELAAPPPLYSLQPLDPATAGEVLASSERNRLGLGDGPIADLWRLLESDVGMRIFSFPIDATSIAGMFLYSSELGACVALNANHPVELQRWSLAHEYAHLLTDRFQAEITVLASRGRESERERMAESFALHFLMPTPGLIRRFQALQLETGGRITPTELLQLGYLYGVSTEAMTNRLEGLNLIPPGTWNRLREAGFKSRSAQQSLNFLPAASEKLRFPMRYVALNVRAFEAGRLSEGQLAKRLMSDRVDTRRWVEESSFAPVLRDGEVLQLPIDLGLELVAKTR